MTDLLCYEDVDAFGRELDDPLAELEQDNYHRLIEAPSSNPDDIDRGFGIEGWLSRATRGDATVDDLKNGIENELLKDSRNSRVVATVTKESNANYRIGIQIVADQATLGISLVADGSGVRRVA